MSDDKDSAEKRLRRLREQASTDLASVVAQRATSTFSLDREPVPEASQTYVRVVVYPQDPFVGDPEVRQMIAHDIHPGLVNARVRIQDESAPIATADEDGYYLFWPGSPQFDQVNTFYYATFTLRMYERYARRALPWSFPTPRISIRPHAGSGANAVYHEQAQLLAFYSFQANGESFNTAQSADVVSHETGHAILDGLRDLFNESFGPVPMAFHESFGDMTAVLVALHDDSLIGRLLDWTKGDLRLNNFIAAVAENMAHGMTETTEAQMQGRTAYLRNALNTLKNIPIGDLMYRPVNPELELGRESHNYSRLFTGAFYDILVALYDHLRREVHPRIALHRARDLAGHLLICAVELGPVGEFDFSDMARAFIAADHCLYQGHYADVLTSSFDARGILSASEAERFITALKTLPDIHLPETMNSALAAALFLEDEIAPALKISSDLALTPLHVYRNAAGYAYVAYFSHRAVKLDGSEFRQYNGSRLDAFGGLTLMFTPEGKLCSVYYRPVRDEDARQIQINTVDMIEQGLVVPAGSTEEKMPGGETIAVGGPMYLDNTPKAIWLPPEPDEDDSKADKPPRLVKLPVHVDPIPTHRLDLVTYLKAWLPKPGDKKRE